MGKNLKDIGLELIKLIKSNNNPFDEYIVITPNSIMEQWFKAFWLKNENSVLMNVKFTRLETFIKDIYNQNETKTFKLDTFKELILLYFLNKKEETKKLLDDDIYNYITINDKYNPTTLYDFVRSLASIYLDYEKKEIELVNKWEEDLYTKIKEYYKDYKSIEEITMNNPLKRKAKVILFGFSHVEKVYLDIFKKIKDKYDFIELKEDFSNIKEIKDELSITSTPSIEKEVEYVHSEICKIIKDDKDARFSDIVVYVPNINDYKSSILKVFIQNNPDFPNIPFVLSNQTLPENEVSEGLEILLDIILSNSFTRKSFYRLTNNKVIQNVKNIDPTYPNGWNDAIINMNVFRNHELCDEWEYARKRILLSKLVGTTIDLENEVEVNNESFVPFAGIDLNDDSISLFIEIIDDIKHFKDEFANKELLNKEDLENLEIELDKWFLNTDSSSNDISFYYKKVKDALSLIKNNLMESTIHRELLFATLIDASKSPSISSSSILTGGVTFLNFNPKSVLYAKHAFIMGMSSNNFPRKDLVNSLFIQTNKQSNSEIDMQTFIKIINNADRCYFSYVGENLKSGEEFFKTPLFNLIKVNKKESKLGVDETREYKDLFTNSEFKRKKYIDDLNNPSNEIKIQNKQYTDLEPFESPKKIKINDLKDYYKENLYFKAKRIIGTFEKDENEMKDEFEPSEIDNITKSDIKKEVFTSLLNIKFNEEEFDDCYDAYFESESYDNEDSLDDDFSNESIEDKQEDDETKILLEKLKKDVLSIDENTIEEETEEDFNDSPKTLEDEIYEKCNTYFPILTSIYTNLYNYDYYDQSQIDDIISSYQFLVELFYIANNKIGFEFYNDVRNSFHDLLKTNYKNEEYIEKCDKFYIEEIEKFKYLNLKEELLKYEESHLIYNKVFFEKTIENSILAYLWYKEIEDDINNKKLKTNIDSITELIKLFDEFKGNRNDVLALYKYASTHKLTKKDENNFQKLCTKLNENNIIESDYENLWDKLKNRIIFDLKEKTLPNLATNIFNYFLNIYLNIIINDLTSKYNLFKKLPYIIIQDDLSKIIKEVVDKYKKIFSIISDVFEICNYVFIEKNKNNYYKMIYLHDEKFSYIDENNNEIKWEVLCNEPILVIDKNNKYIFELDGKLKESGLSKYTKLYCLALIYVSSLKIDKTIKISLENKNEFEINSAQANEILNISYQNMFNYTNCQFFILDKYSKMFKIAYDENLSFNDLKNIISENMLALNSFSHTTWSFFNEAPLFDNISQSGYTRENYKREVEIMVINKINEILYLPKIVLDNDEKEGK